MSKEFERKVMKELVLMNRTMSHYVQVINNLKVSRDKHTGEIKDLEERVRNLENAGKIQGP